MLVLIVCREDRYLGVYVGYLCHACIVYPYRYHTPYVSCRKRSQTYIQALPYERRIHTSILPSHTLSSSSPPSPSSSSLFSSIPFNIVPICWIQITFSANLLPVSTPTKSLDCCVKLFPSHWVLQTFRIRQCSSYWEWMWCWWSISPRFISLSFQCT